MPRLLLSALGLVAVLATTAAEARAPSTAPEYRARAAEAVAKGAYSRALRLLEEGLGRFPDDPGLHQRYGTVLAKIHDLRGARKHLEIAHKTLADDPGLLVELGWVHLADGDLDAATRLARRAVELTRAGARRRERKGASPRMESTRAGAGRGERNGTSPDERKGTSPDERKGTSPDERAAELLFNLEIHRRIRAGEPPRLTNDATRAVFRIITAVGSGELEKVFQRDVAPATIDRIREAAKAGPRLSRDQVRRAVAESLRRGWANLFDKPGNRYAGFDVQPEPELRGPEHHVFVNLLVRRSMDAEQVAQIKRFAADPRFAQYIDPAITEVLRGLEAADRERYFERLEKHESWTFVGTVWVMVKRGERYLVRDVKLGDKSFAELIGAYREAADQGLVKTSKARRRTGVWRSLARLVGVAAILFIVIMLIRRRAAR